MSQSRTTGRRKDAEPGCEDQTEAVATGAAEKTDDDIVAQTDGLLDEIDALLEDQSVLIGFRQRSGQ